jgi:SAM-dependent methyltransferase
MLALIMKTWLFKWRKKPMVKSGDIAYMQNIGEGGRTHAINKPFSDNDCGRFLIDIGAVFSLLPPAPAKLLDLGCGTGWTSCFFAKRGYNVVGQDISSDMIESANANKDKEGLSNLTFVVSDYENMTFEAVFDAAVFFDSLHHAENETAALAMVYKALKPGGVCITVEPGQGHAKRQVTREQVAKYNVTERDMPPYRIIAAAKAAGFRRFQVYPKLTLINMVLVNRFNSNLINSLLRVDVLRGLAVFLLMTLLKRYQGMVVLTK